MSSITISYRGIPLPTTTHNDTKRGYGRVYSSPALKSAIMTYATLVAPFRPKTPITGPVSLELEVTFPWRKTDSKKARVRKVPKSTKPDLTNMLKTIEDVLQNSGFFVNDSQVAKITASKWFGDDYEIVIRIKEI